MSNNSHNGVKQNNKRRITTADVAFTAVLIALALVFGYVESQIRLEFIAPGVKLGLCNLVIICALYLLGVKYAFIISLARIFLIGFMIGPPIMIPYSLAGGMFSLLIMVLLHKFTKLSVITISCIGGICHNIGQICVAIVVMGTSSIAYTWFPILLIAGFVTGLAIGIVCSLILPPVQKSLQSVSRR